jgi:signal transduction histidine kinase
MVAFAGHPLVVGDRVIGVVAAFARQPLSQVVLDAMSAIARAVAIGIERKHSEKRLEEIQRELVTTSRKAGMAEVANNVLHNVGNVLNNLNVSATVVGDHLRRSRVSGVGKAVKLLREHEADLGAFLSKDEKGKRVMAYLGELADHLAAEQTAVLAELSSLARSIDHIKHVVSRQRAYAGDCGVIETVSVTSVVEDAVKINGAALTRHGIRVEREFCEVPPFPMDKHKLLQVLVNLIRNAKEAMEGLSAHRKVLTLRVRRDDGGVGIDVIDRGTGIDPADLTRIFAHGFTTKQGGNGYGLHSSVLAAEELSGSLTARSEGRGQGAMFTIRIPMQKVEARR